MVEVVVMHPTNIQLDSAYVGDDADGNPVYGGKMPFRWRGEVSQEEYDMACASDDAAGRAHRLMDVGAAEKPKAAPKKKPRGRPKKVAE